MRIARFLFLLVICGTATAQTIPPGKEAAQLAKLLTEKHFSPVPLNDDFFRRVWTNIVAEIDPDRLYLMGNEASNLESMAVDIDNDLATASWTFFPVLHKTYAAALNRSRSIIEEISSTPISETTEEMAMDSAWAITSEQWNERWRKLLKLYTLEEIALASKNTQSLYKTAFRNHEVRARERVRYRELRAIDRTLNHPSGFETYLKNIFMKAVSSAFDPHSQYMSSEQMESFIDGLSTEGYYFGFSANKNSDGQVIIRNITPGDPAWGSGVMSIGDIIEMVRWEGKEWIDLSLLDDDEVDLIFTESNTAAMEFSLRKVDGSVRTVKLRKARKESESGLVRGFILQGEKQIGYIALPSFYSDFYGDGGQRCANDVAKEIIKLRNQKIDGLILDLRFNGGGSLAEAVEMAGIFVDVGPVGINFERGREPETLKDLHRGTVYDGPLVIMVHSISASASEFFASAMQDYRRAVIVGSPTYGKAIAQQMFSLQPGKPIVDYKMIKANKGWGYSTITTSKIYRINGKTIQRSGVRPDVVIPDVYSAVYPREADAPFSMASDSVRKKTYWQPGKLLPADVLQMRSVNRISTHVGFNAQRTYIDWVKRENARKRWVLDWTSVQQYKNEEWSVSKTFSDEISKPVSAFKVDLHEYGRASAKSEYTTVINDAWMTSLSKDMYLEEAFNIMCDYINWQKGN